MLFLENSNFQNLRKAFFWHSGTDACIIADAVNTKLKGNFFGDPPLYISHFSTGFPFDTIFLAWARLNSTRHPPTS